MSVKISGCDIYLTRGDTLYATVSLTAEDGTAYVPTEGDVLTFAVKRNYGDAAPLISKGIPTDSMVLLLNPADTQGLFPGKYVYDIQLTMADGDTFTVIPANPSQQATFRLAADINP